MEFTFETLYRHRELKAMSRTLRKTLRKEKCHKINFACIILSICCILLPFVPKDGGFRFDLMTIISFGFAAALIIIFICHDDLNALLAQKYAIPGTDRCVTVFSEDGYISTTEVEKKNWTYDIHVLTVETDDYFIFHFDDTSANLYDKRHMSGGTAEEFRMFIRRKTGKGVVYVK